MQPIIISPVFTQLRNPYAPEARQALVGGARVHRIHDPFFPSAVPLFVYHPKFVAPYPIGDRDASILHETGMRARWVAFTPFQLRLRGIQLNAEEAADFESGHLICIFPAHDPERARTKGGRPGDGPLATAIGTAFCAHSLRTAYAVQATWLAEPSYDQVRKHNPLFLTEPEERLDSDVWITEALIAIDDELAKYDRYIGKTGRRSVALSAKSITRRGRAVCEDWFGMKPKHLKRAVLLETACFEQLHGKLSKRRDRKGDFEYVRQFELGMLSILRNLHLRAKGLGAVMMGSGRDDLARYGHLQPDTLCRIARWRDPRHALQNGDESGLGEADLTIRGCVSASLYSGIDPALLFFAHHKHTALFEATAWLGYLGRSPSGLRLPPEIADTLGGIMCWEDTNPADTDEMAQCYRDLQTIGELVAGCDAIASAAAAAKETIEPQQVDRRRYGVQLAGAGKDHVVGIRSARIKFAARPRPEAFAGLADESELHLFTSALW